MKKVIIFIFVFISVHVVSMAARLAAECIDYSFISNNAMRQLFYQFVTYALQLVLTVVMIKLFAVRRLTDAGFNLKNRSQSMKTFRHFMLVWTGVLLVFYTLALLLIPSFLDYLKSFCPPDVHYVVRSVVGGSVLAGLGEEPLFRGFAVLLLAKHWQGAIQIGRHRLSHVSLLSGFIFMTAHVGFSIVPRFEITHFDALQLTYTFVLGVAWATMLEKTKSLLAPVVSHIWANFIQYALGYVAVYLLF